MRRTKVLSVVALLLALMCSVPAAWGAELSAPGELPLSNETIAITVGVPQSALVEDWETNRYTQLLEKELNMDLQFVMLPPGGSEFNQKLELMMIAGGDDLPEVIIGTFDSSTLVNYAQMGLVRPVTEYYKNLSYFTRETCELCTMSMEEMLSYVTSYDGEVYGMFSISESLNNMYAPSRMLIYKPWLDELNLDMPKTTEDLVNVLRAFKENDLNHNGQQDEIPLMGYAGVVKSNLLRPLMNPFVYSQSNYYMVDENGQVTLSAMQEGFREGLRYVEQLFNEGLISPLSLTQDKKQLTALLSQKETVIGVLANISTTLLPASDARRNEYYVIEPLTGPSGIKQTAKEPSLPKLAMIITKNCKNPEAAFRMGDFMCREDVSLFNRFGEENVEWRILETPGDSDYAPLGYAGDIEQMLNPWGSLQNTYWGNLGPQIMNGTFVFRIAAAPNATNYTGNRRLAEGLIKEIQYANPKYVAGLVYNEEEQEIINEYMGTINSYIEESFTAFVTGRMSIEKDWDTYLNNFKRMGVDEYLKAVNGAYARQQAK